MTTSSAPAGSLWVLLIEDDDDDALIVEDLLPPVRAMFACPAGAR